MEKKALIIVDVQKAFDDKKWGDRNNPNAEENISKILKLWREKDWKVIYVQHMSDNPASVFHPNNEGYAKKDIVEPEGKDLINLLISCFVVRIVANSSCNVANEMSCMDSAS